MSPIYEYRCPECKATQERLEPFDSPRPICVHCQGSEMERMPPTGTTWHFKGEESHG